MNELNDLRKVNECIKAFVDASFYSFTDFDKNFPFSFESKFSISLFDKSLKNDNDVYFINTLYKENAVDVYLSEVLRNVFLRVIRNL